MGNKRSKHLDSLQNEYIKVMESSKIENEDALQMETSLVKMKLNSR